MAREVSLAVLVGGFELSGSFFFPFRVVNGLSRKNVEIAALEILKKIDWTRSWANLLHLVLLGLEHWTQWPSGDHSNKLCWNSMTLIVNHKIRWAITASLCKEGQTNFLTEKYFTQFAQGKTEPLEFTKIGIYSSAGISMYWNTIIPKYSCVYIYIHTYTYIYTPIYGVEYLVICSNSYILDQARNDWKLKAQIWDVEKGFIFSESRTHPTVS